MPHLQVSPPSLPGPWCCVLALCLTYRSALPLFLVLGVVSLPCASPTGQPSLSSWSLVLCPCLVPHLQVSPPSLPGPCCSVLALCLTYRSALPLFLVLAVVSLPCASPTGQPPLSSWSLVLCPCFVQAYFSCGCKNGV